MQSDFGLCFYLVHSSVSSHSVTKGLVHIAWMCISFLLNLIYMMGDLLQITLFLYFIFFSIEILTLCMLANFACFFVICGFLFKLTFSKKKNLSGIPSECQTVWIQIRPNILLGLIRVQTVCIGYQLTTKVITSGKELRWKLVSLSERVTQPIICLPFLSVIPV